MKVLIDQECYDSMVEEINLLQELLAEANNRIVELEGNLLMGLPKQFKPIKDMTFEDWVEASREGYCFKTRAGQIVDVIQMDRCSRRAVKTKVGWHTVDGCHYMADDEVADDIIERIS